MSIQKFFQVDIGIDDKGNYVAQILVLSEKKGLMYVGPSLKSVLPKVKKALLQKNSEMRKFPLPEESRVPLPNGQRAIMRGESVIAT